MSFKLPRESLSNWTSRPGLQILPKNSPQIAAYCILNLIVPSVSWAEVDFTQLDQQAGLSQILLVFGFGIVTSFTPCVYPLIPVTMAIFGAKKDAPRSRSMMLAAMYVLGLCITYTALGLFSALTGAIFGSFLGNPLVIAAVGLMLAVLLLYNFDLIPIPLVQVLQNRANRIGGSGFLGAFSMGLVSGVIAAPCTGPALVAILAVAGRGGEPLWGAVLLFFYALGIGMLFLALAAFSSLGSKLPKSGKWLLGAKYLIGTAIVLVITIFVRPVLPAGTLLIPRSMAYAGATLGPLLGAYGILRINKWVQFLSALIVGVSLFSLSLHAPKVMPPTKLASTVEAHQELNWYSNLEEGLNKSGDKIVMVDLYADWCAACKEFDVITFEDNDVKKALSNFVLVRLDFTSPSEIEDLITEKYGIQGLPTILFLRADGSEISSSRITGFQAPSKFLQHITSVR